MLSRLQNPSCRYILTCLLLFFVSETTYSQQQLWNTTKGVDPTSAHYINNIPNRLNCFEHRTAPLPRPMVSGRVHHRPSLEGVFLGRSDISGPTFVFDAMGPVLAASDLTFDLEAGYRVGYSFFTADEGGLEFSLLSHQNNLQETVDGPSVTPVFFGGVPATPVSSYEVIYEVEMLSYEANYWIRANQSTRLGIGGRVFDFSETFDILFDDTSDGFFGSTNNDLYGLQLLAERRHRIGRSNLVLGAKAGGFFNDLEVEGVTQSAELQRRGDEFSFVIEYRAGLEFQLDFMTRIFAGYQGMYVTDLAIAPTQSEALSVFSPSTGSIILEDVTYNGLYFGASMTF